MPSKLLGLHTVAGRVQALAALVPMVLADLLNGAAETLLDPWFAMSGLNIAITVPQFDGCS